MAESRVALTFGVDQSVQKCVAMAAHKLRQNGLLEFRRCGRIAHKEAVIQKVCFVFVDKCFQLAARSLQIHVSNPRGIKRHGTTESGAAIETRVNPAETARPPEAAPARRTAKATVSAGATAVRVE